MVARREERQVGRIGLLLAAGCSPHVGAVGHM